MSEQFALRLRLSELPRPDTYAAIYKRIHNDDTYNGLIKLIKDPFALKFATFLLSLNEKTTVTKNENCKFSLCEIFPIRHAKKEYDINDEESTVIVIMKRNNNSEEKIYEERVQIRQIKRGRFNQFQSSDDEYLNMALFDMVVFSIETPEKIHALAVVFLMRAISTFCENPHFFIPSTDHEKQLYIVSNKVNRLPIDEERLKKRAVVIINYLIRELSKSESLQESKSIHERYSHELSVIGMAPVSICHLNEDILPSLVADGKTDLNKIKFDEYFSVHSSSIQNSVKTVMKFVLLENETRKSCRKSWLAFTYGPL